MLSHEFDKEKGILYAAPNGRLEKQDFLEITSEIDPYIEKNGKVNGIIVTTRRFPYWKDFEALLSHLKFIQNHHQHVKKIAVVSDNLLASVMPALVKHFVGAQIRHFQSDDRNLAETWIMSGAQKKAS